MQVASRIALALTGALLAGCATESSRSSNEETAVAGLTATAAPERDLTLQMPATAAVEVASAIELSRPSPHPRLAPRPKASPRPAPAATPDPIPEAAPVAEAAAVVPAGAIAEVVAAPAPVEDAAEGAGRELAPGKTVTIIPASSGPSSAPEEPEWVPAERSRGTMIIGGGRGGRCRPRGGGRGIGIAGRIPIGLSGPDLR
jgi:hypothetical protein